MASIICIDFGFSTAFPLASSQDTLPSLSVTRTLPPNAVRHLPSAPCVVSGGASIGVAPPMLRYCAGSPIGFCPGERYQRSAFGRADEALPVACCVWDWRAAISGSSEMP